MLVLLACAAAAGFGVRFGDALWAQAKEEAKMLFDFENADDAAQWEAANAATSIVAEHATSGKSAMKVVLEGAEYPGINTAKIANDWSGYKELKFDVFADQAFNLAVRIDDENSKDYAGRYNLDQNDLNKGANTVTITLGDVGDKIDLKKVKLFILFGINPAKDTTYYLDNVRLVK
jgi:hypothetical protein